MPKVLYEKRDRIAYVTLNRPDAHNAIDPDVHALLVEIWSDFRDDDAVDVAILTGAGDAFCAGADLKTYIPPIIEDATPRADPRDRRPRPRRPHARPAPHLQAGHRGGQRMGAGRRPGDRARVRHPHRLRARALRLVRGAPRLPPRRRRHRPAGQHLRRRGGARDAAHRRADRRRSARCSATWSRGWCPHERLMEEAELTARQILRNSQRAVRSAKETILDVIGRPLDEQLRTEALNGYTLRRPRRDARAARALLRQVRRGPRGRARDAAVGPLPAAPGPSRPPRYPRAR